VAIAMSTAKEMAGFTVPNVFSQAGFDPNLKMDLVYLFIKRGITQFLQTQ
jgi:hypothetical protein